MNPIHVFMFITFCGILGIFLRYNLQNIIASFLQISIGLNALFNNLMTNTENNIFTTYTLFFLIFLVVLFIEAIAILMIRRRSTLHINELTELRG